MPRKKREVFPIFMEEMDRRQFLKCSALLGGSLALPPAVWHLFGGSEAVFADVGGAYLHHRPENQIYSVCQQCNTNCGIKVKIVDGMVAKIDGNPYNPWTMTPHIPYNTPHRRGGRDRRGLCPKGQAGIQTLYDPYRIVKVLKRAGKRGENKWKTIPFEQAIQEIVDGGDLFGERPVEGLKDICALKDPKISAALAEDAAQVASKKMTLEDFKEEARRQSSLSHRPRPSRPGAEEQPALPELGPVEGRARRDAEAVLSTPALGSVNAHGHTTVCQGSLYFGCKAMSDQFVEGKWSGGSKFYWQADTGNAEFILFVGANPYEANYGPPLRAEKMTEGMADGTAEDRRGGPAVLQDGGPRLEVAPRQAQRGRRPGNGDDALDPRERALRCPLSGQRQQGRRHGRQGAHLDTGGIARQTHVPTANRRSFLRASEIGLKTEKRTKKDGEEWTFDPFLVFEGRQDSRPSTPTTRKIPSEGDLFVDTEIKGIKAKSVLQVYREAAGARTLADWAKTRGHQGDRTSWNWRRNLRATGRRPSSTFTAAFPSTPPDSTTSSSA